MLEAPPSLWPPERNERSKMVNPTLPRADFYVYVIFRPNGIPCYIGKGCGFRYRMHEYRKGGHNPHLNNIMRNAGGSLPTVRIRSDMTEIEAFELEKLLIGTIGRKAHGGPLTNQTDGGEGGSGAVRSDEYREKQSKAQSGKKATPETRAKLSARHKGHKLSSAHKEALHNSRRGKKPSPETIALMRLAYTPERSKAQSERNLGNKYGIGNKRTPEGNARVIASVIKTNSTRPVTDEYRAKRSAIAKAMWAKRDAAQRSAWSAKARGLDRGSDDRVGGGGTST